MTDQQIIELGKRRLELLEINSYNSQSAQCDVYTAWYIQKIFGQAEVVYGKLASHISSWSTDKNSRFQDGSLATHQALILGVKSWDNHEQSMDSTIKYALERLVQSHETDSIIIHKAKALLQNFKD